MSDIEDKVNNSAVFYNQSFLNVDYKLAEFSFKTLQPFFKGPEALELGPATGYMTELLTREFETLHLVEGSKDLLDQIPDYPHVTKFHSMFEDFDTDIRFHTIVMSHVLEHISDPIHVLRRIYGWLHNEGVFLVSVPNAKSIHRMVAVEMGLLSDEYTLNQRDHELGHYRVYDLDSLKKDMVEAGFKVINSGGYFLKPLSNGQMEQHWTEEMIKGFYKVGKYFQYNCAEIFVVCSK